MIQETRYRYEQRIKQLEQRIDKLGVYRDICSRINDTVCSTIQEEKQISNAWIMRQFFKDAWK